MRQPVCVKVFLFAFVVSLCFSWPSDAEEGSFSQWLTELRAEAVAQGISQHILDRAFAGVSPIPRVIELDRKQPEFVQTFSRYFETRVTPERVLWGRAKFDEHRGLLRSVAGRYGVDPEVIVAFWGLETNYGSFTGQYRAVDALATLAYNGRRAAFFRGELIAVLHLMEKGDVPVDALSSWAGALGQMQFMPSTYLAYAVDADGDGHRDLWNSPADAFASAGHYLSAMGWENAKPWGQEVRLPETFDYYLSGGDTALAAADWHRLGVRSVSGPDLSMTDTVGSIVLPAGAFQGPALLVYKNFKTIMRWNRSTFYAVAVGNLSDQIAGGRPFQARSDSGEPRLSRADIREMQTRLAALGYDTGGVDGIIGSQTRRAIRGFQRSQALPPDGHPSVTVLHELRSEVQDLPDPRPWEGANAQKAPNGL